MNTFKSLILGSLIRINSLHGYKAKQVNFAQVSHAALTAKPTLDSLTWKELKAMVTKAKIKGRSKLTTKKLMIAALAKLA